MDDLVTRLGNEDIAKQQENFNKLIAKLGEVNSEEVKQALSKREIVEPEAELTPEIINRLQAKIQNQNQNQ